MREGNLAEGDFDARTRDYYLYAQWIASEQMRSAAEGARESGVSLYLDLPLGASRDGYDVWRHREVFASQATVGAPPDPVFSHGQNWGFCPLHPQALREQGYRYAVDFLAHHMQFSGMLRIDHAMGLHRLYWIPDGMDASHGVFVTYRADEMYAVLNLESHRHETALVGENLGTVPSYVNSAMNRHRIRQMYVVQYELEPDRSAAINRVPKNCVASLNTHDMPTFAAFWDGADVDDRLALRLLTEEAARSERAYRARLHERLVEWLRSQGLLDDADADVQSVMRGILEFLAVSPAEVVIVSLEDLWLETRPQNVPGTSTERANWVRKALHGLEAIREMPEVVDMLERVSRQRAGSTPLAPAGAPGG
jgi:4-alpha-glucanotransferase